MLKNLCERCSSEFSNELSGSFCPTCSGQAEDTKNSDISLEPDYYFDPNGLMVFTAAYHRKRGYCCKNNCRHCPF